MHATKIAGPEGPPAGQISFSEELLRAAVGAIADGRNEEGAALLELLTAEHIDVEQRPEDLDYLIFAAALGKRLGRRTPGMTACQRRFHVSQDSLSRLVAEQLPVARLAAVMANEVLAAVVGGEDEVTLLDIGIGTAQQEVALIRLLASQQRLPRTLHVVGIEPSGKSLREAQVRLAEAARAADLDLRFTAIQRAAEDIPDSEWQAIRAAHGGRLVINAAFAAHRIAGPVPLGNTRTRGAVISRLRRLDPAAIVLVEPNVDQQELDLRRRFEQSWHHYAAIFRLIDRLDLAREERAALKLFFSAEVEDAVATAEAARTLRYEPTATWLERLQGCGFVPATGLEQLRAIAGPGVEVVGRPGYVGVTLDKELIVSIVCAGAQPIHLHGLQVPAPAARATRRRATNGLSARPGMPLSRLDAREHSEAA